ncbi:hypothetical protein [Nitrobacter winogradskyi]|uniref:Uncharacterized protein n=2 Tax=Nitrobacter winogradskyi TaxID=913 RepID=A0ACC6AIR0_NITWI|nr:hypothetical protein [Nitrobacter winogradskyi]MCP1999742.1 hypothetical protein [Nitrobacter winogradskyi]GEC15848.1 hypothetical protein NWI01_17400 [Nitrobacter winogradskyi]
MMTVDDIFADDRCNPPAKRSLPWEETCGGVTVVVEPKPHWASDMTVFRLTERSWCSYADWIENGPAARFIDHPETRGDDVMMKARAMVGREIALGRWSDREGES